jgi:hypothetical protein
MQFLKYVDMYLMKKFERDQNPANSKISIILFFSFFDCGILVPILTQYTLSNIRCKL